MIKEVHIKNADQVKSLCYAASRFFCDIGIHDTNGRIADAKSFLGLMALNYTEPVHIVTENEYAIKKLMKAIA